MSLKTLSLSTKTLELPNGQLTVRGLSLDDILILVGLYKPAMETIYEQISSINSDPERAQEIEAIVANFVTDMPDFVSTLIVMGAGEDVNDKESHRAARMIDFGSQVAIINAIGEATFASGGGAGNVFRLIVRAVQGTTSLLKSQTA